ncbi:MAG: asparaginase [Rhodoglobus sp.]|nr:asparaginase [Rhodoglobus sp.]
MAKGVLVISLGGTISSARAQGSDSSLAVPVLDAEDLSSSLRSVHHGLEISTLTLRREPSASLDLAIAAEIVDRVAAAAGVLGVVITQGTDTLEDVAFLTDLLYGGDMPIVFTGAMRPADALGAEGLANLSAAIQVARSQEARGLGVLVVMNDQVHAARWVRKLHTSSVSAFGSPSVGPLGWISEGRLRMVLRTSERRRPIPTGDTPLPQVCVVGIGLGESGHQIRSIDSDHYSGLVIEALGGGHVPAQSLGVIGEAAQRMPVVFASRTGAGATLARTYGYQGSETSLQALGVIPAGELPANKARILLAVGIASAKAHQRETDQHIAEVAQIFARYSGA